MKSTLSSKTAALVIAGLAIGSIAAPTWQRPLLQEQLWPRPEAGAAIVEGDLDRAESGLDSNWTNPFPAVDGYVTALATHGDVLYAGGFFATAGGKIVNHIAKWDGMRWHNLGFGVNQAVYALLVDEDGILYAGGNFTTAGGVAAKFIARWDGERWSDMGRGMDKFVQALALGKNGMLYAGGAFTRAGSVEANYVAAWDGMRWHNLGVGTDHNVFALAVAPDGSVFAAGGFMTAGDEEAYQVAGWDGTRWHSLGEGMNGHIWGRPVWALALANDGTLYAGGNFNLAAGGPGNYIAQWNGYRWSPVGGGVNGMVRALVIGAGGELYAGGYFTRAGTEPANHVARWDGRRWHSLASGTDHLVDALVEDISGTLHVGGSFQTAGRQSARSLACWNAAPASAMNIPPPDYSWNAPILDAAYPNPFTTNTALPFSLPRPIHATLKVFDTLGRERLTLVDNFLNAGTHSVMLDGSGLPSGLYIYCLEADGWHRSGIVILRK